MSNKSVLTVAALAMAMICAAPAGAADGSASTTISVQAVVPVICRVQLSASMAEPDSEGLVDLGAAQEFCNAPRGYRVLVQHAANLTHASFIVGGVRIPLSASGETVLTDSSQPASRSVRLMLDLGDAGAQLSSLGVRIEAKG